MGLSPKYVKNSMLSINNGRAVLPIRTLTFSVVYNTILVQAVNQRFILARWDG